MSANDSFPESRAERLQNLHAASLRLFGLLTAQQPETALLQQAIESLAELIGARYGVIGVLDDAGKLAQFVYTGVTPEEAAHIGYPPEGRGLLGAVIQENRALRLDDMGQDPRAVGFPPHHPPMKSLLAVPVSHEDQAYGRVYLSEKKDGKPFTDEDEQLVTRFAEALALTIRFHRDEARRLRAQSALENVAHAVSTVTGEEFFGTLVRDLAKTLAVDYAFVGELMPGRDNAIRTVAVSARGQLADNFTYELAGTPCNNVVVDKAPCLYPSDIRQQFPDDHLLREMDVESYLGCPLFGSTGQLLGVLAIMDSKPMHDAGGSQAIMQICAARAAAELERLGAERQRRQSEQRQRALLRAIPDLLLRIRGDGTYLDFKPAQQFRTYAPPNAFLGKKPADVLPPAIADEHMALIRRALATGQTQVSRYRLDIDGAPHDYEARIVPSGEDEVLGIVRDVTEERRAAEQMRKLSSAIEQTADSVLITDADGTIEYVNPAFERTTGYTAAQALGHKPSLVKSGLHDDAFYQRLWQTLRQGEPFRDIFINRRKNGDLYFEEKTITPLKDGAGRTTHFVSTGKNITERMQAEIALRESERRYHAMAEVSPVGIFRTDTDGKCLYVNRRWCEIAGITADAARGDGWAQSLHPEDREQIFTEWNRAVQENRPFQMEYRFRTPDGIVTWVLGQAIAEHDDQGNPVGYIGTVTDISERKRTEEALARATSEWTNSMDFMEDALYLIDLDDKVIRANRAFYRLTGLSPDRVIGQDITSLMHPGGETVPCRVCAARCARHDATVVMEADDADNPTGRPIEVIVRIVRDTEDRPASVLMGIRDLTRTRQVEADLRQSRAKLIEAQRMAQLGNWEFDLAANQLTWSDEIYRIFEIDPAKFGASYEALLDAIHPDDRELVNSAYTESVKNKTPYDIEHRLLMKDGRIKHVHERCETFYDDTGKPLRSVGAVQDITERKRTEEQLNYLAYYDTLTGLPNRTLLLERLKQAMLDAERVDRLVAVMFLDLDRFKYINDTLGHHVGDGLLKAVAERLEECVRPGDTIARLGGDEFTVVLANVAHVDDVARVARKLIDSFASPFRVDGHELFTTTSIGITLYPFDERDAEGLLKNADAAMYHAKERGRNTFQYFTAELNVRAERRLKIETALRQALERNELSLHYQPQVDLKSGRIVGMEALARWKHPELGTVSPVEFIPVAEETGLILPIGEWVLHEACRQIKTWHDTGFAKLQVAVNLSGKQLRQKDLPDRVREMLRETKLESRYLDLELTESLLMVDTEETAGIMHALHAMGVSFSVDDFGTGYSSLAYLKRFPIDVLKIDRSFVRDIASDPNDVAIVKTIIAMAHTLGMRVIAEGVETREQLEFLRNQGCDGSQGYYCSMPLSAEEFSELLVDWKRIHADRCQRTSQTQRASRQRRPAKGKPRGRARRKPSVA